VHFEQTTLSVRVIALVPTPEKAEALRRKKEHEARAKGRKLSEQARFLAGFILLVTTLPLPQWPTALVIELYACRWHIEVLFKRIKQVLDLHTLRCETPETAQAVIAALLVAWLLIEEDLEGLRRQLGSRRTFRRGAEYLATGSPGLGEFATGCQGLVQSPTTPRGAPRVSPTLP